MDKLSIWTGCGLLICLSLIGTHADECSQENQKACQVTYYNEFMYIPGDDKAFPLLTEARFNEICGNRDAYVGCISSLGDNCTEKAFQGIGNVHDYLCVNGGKEKYFDVLACFNNSEVQKEASDCQDTGRQEMAKIGDQLFRANPPPNEEKTKDLIKQYCKVIKEWQFDCMYKLLTEECDDEAALYQYSFDRAGWKSILEKNGCDPLDEDPTSATGTLGCTLLVHLAAILLVWFKCVA